MKRNRFKYVLISLVLVFVGGFYITNKTPTVSVDYTGTYEFIYPHAGGSLNENHLIILDKSNFKYKGLYFGTSDEFQSAREHHLPGYFVADMNDIRIHEGKIAFILDVPNSDIFTDRFPTDITSSDEARQKGYVNWSHKMTFIPKEYEGTVIGFNSIDIDGKIFVKN